MLMGGAFGYWAGWVAPGLFGTSPTGAPMAPTDAGLAEGAATGVFLGGVLAAFAILIQTAHQWIRTAGERNRFAPLLLDRPDLDEAAGVGRAGKEQGLRATRNPEGGSAHRR
jgi:hypothetical protein